MAETHYLKTWPQFFRAVQSGEKTFEVRRDDRSFQKGDILVLCEFDPRQVNAEYTEERLVREVTYVLRGGQFGIEVGFVVLGLAEVAPPVSYPKGESA